MAVVSARKLMLVLGATGFLGRFVVERMLACQYPLRVVSRGTSDWQSSNVSSLRYKGAEVIIGDINDESTVERLVADASAIVNMVGSFQESKDASFEDLNVAAVEKLVQHGIAKGVQRFVQVSCLGARPQADCRYFQTKWRGEEIVRGSKLYWTVFRPSFMFGEKFPLLEYVKPLLTFKLFLPVIGSGTNTIQPVFVEDVADCIVESIYARHTVGKSYDLVGPDDYQMIELLEMVRKSLGIGGPSMNIPSQFTGKTFDMLSKALPRLFLTNDLAGMMSDDSLSDREAMLADFQVKYVSLGQYLPKIVEALAL